MYKVNYNGRMSYVSNYFYCYIRVYFSITGIA